MAEWAEAHLETSPDQSNLNVHAEVSTISITFWDSVSGLVYRNLGEIQTVSGRPCSINNSVRQFMFQFPLEHVFSTSLCCFSHYQMKSGVFSGHDRWNPLHSITSQKTRMLKFPVDNVFPTWDICTVTEYFFKKSLCVIYVLTHAFQIDDVLHTHACGISSGCLYVTNGLNSVHNLGARIDTNLWLMAHNMDFHLFLCSHKATSTLVNISVVCWMWKFNAQSFTTRLNVLAT
jgi:hypothetical protein